jgi:mRNA interferase HicA
VVKITWELKYSELHRLIRKNGWRFKHAEGSHYFYEKEGILSPPVPFHGVKEIGEGLKSKLIKEMDLK